MTLRPSSSLWPSPSGVVGPTGVGGSGSTRCFGASAGVAAAEVERGGGEGEGECTIS